MLYQVVSFNECFVAFDQCEADAETFDITHGKLLKTLMRP